MEVLKESIKKAGGVVKAAEVCGVSQRAVYKWLASGSLPRTDYTGETNYATRLADAALKLGNPFDAEWLLTKASPNKSAA